MTLNKTDWIEIVENAISWIVVLAMFVYGFGKSIQFEGAAATDTMVKDLSGMELMWAFYGYSIYMELEFILLDGFFFGLRKVYVKKMK